ncbi:MAG: NAD(P)H-hydrate dehydratase [Bacteroidia bacterium]|nr:NAD(P)H-hydrate dehydratase [Bacteroidia bacterium]
MIKVLDIAAIRAADAATIQRQNIKSIELMERAAAGCSHWLLEHSRPGESFMVFCGKGNNGGDGLAIARLLWKKGKEVSVCILENTGNASDDFTTNLGEWNRVSGNKTLVISSEKDFPVSGPDTILIDAIFGSGFNRAPEDPVNGIIRKMNQSGCKIIAIDLPSGLPGDRASDHPKDIVRATVTLSFQVPKQVFFYAEYGEFTGEIELIDIGLDESFLREAPAIGFVPDDQDIAALLPSRPLFGHKGTFGHALLLAGSYGKAGAAILATQACLRSGAGLVTLRTPEKCVHAVQVAAPEALCSPDEELTHLTGIIKPSAYTAIGIGPGIGTDHQTGNVLKRLFQDFDVPMVLDADAMNLLAENPTWLSFLPAGCILTPHPGEFARLAGKIADPFERTGKQLEMAEKYNCYIILKGRFTTIACPDRQLFFNPTGNHGMAKGGSGDVLTGLLTGLLAQGLSPMKACLTGVYLHGLAGDLCAKNTSPVSMTSGDLINYFDAAWNELRMYRGN